MIANELFNSLGSLLPKMRTLSKGNRILSIFFQSIFDIFFYGVLGLINSFFLIVKAKIVKHIETKRRETETKQINTPENERFTY